MSLNDYINSEWSDLLESEGLMDFETLWTCELKAVDEANRRGGGWSQVFLLSLATSEGHVRKAIVKRQLNYRSRTIGNLLCPIPTFLKEFDNIQRCQKFNIPSMKTVYYGERKDNAGHRAILITEYLEGYIPLGQLSEQWLKANELEHHTKKGIAEATGLLIRKLHQHRLCHRHLYPKHVFVKIDDDTVNIRLIDLEGMHHVPFGTAHQKRDLETFIRRNRFWQNPDWLRFLLSYSKTNVSNKSVRKLFEKIRKQK